MEEIIKTIKPVVRKFYDDHKELFKLQAMDYPDLLQEVSIKVWELNPHELDNIFWKSIHNHLRNLRDKGKKYTREKPESEHIPRETDNRWEKLIDTFGELEHKKHGGDNNAEFPQPIEDVLGAYTMPEIDQGTFDIAKEVLTEQEYAVIEAVFKDGLTFKNDKPNFSLLAKKFKTNDNDIRRCYFKALGKLKKNLSK